MQYKAISNITFSKIICLLIFIFQIFISQSLFAGITDGLVAHYEFEGNADDSSGNGNNGTENGGVTYTTGVIGQAASFDGVDGYIDVPHDNSLSPQKFTLSSWVNVAADTQYDPILLKGRYNGDWYGNNQREYQLITNYGAYLGSDLVWHKSDLINPAVAEKWEMLTLSYDGNLLKMYKNGALENSLESSSTLNVPNSPESLTIGSAFDVENGLLGNVHQALKGKLDDVRIYNRALTSTEITELYNLGTDTTPDAFTFTDQTNVSLSTQTTSNTITVSGINANATISITNGEYEINGDGNWLTTDSTVANTDTVKVRHTSSGSYSSTVDTTLTIGGISDIFTSTTGTALDDGLVAHYEFEGNANDSSGNGNDGTEFGGVTYTTGVKGQAASFDGVDDYVDVPHSNTLNLNRPLTISLWMKPQSQTSGLINSHGIRATPVLTKSTHTENNYSIWIDEQLDSIAYQQYANTSEAQITFNTTHHFLPLFSYITVVRDESIVKIYIDGSLVLEESADYDAVQKLGSLLIGYDGGFGYGKYKGQLDDLRIYNRALTTTEITELYNQSLWGIDNSSIMNIANWTNINTGNFNEVNDGIEIFGSGYRSVGRICTNNKYNFKNNEILIKWKPGSDTGYAGYGFSINSGLSEDDKIFNYGPFTTDHSYNGSFLIDHTKTYYTRVIIGENETITVKTALNNYDNQGGQLVLDETKTIYDGGLDFIDNSHFCFGLWDNYSGTSASTILMDLVIGNAVNDTVLIDDNFDSLDSSTWLVARVNQTWTNMPTDNSAVSFNNGIITLLNDQTDNGPVLISKSFKTPTSGILTIERKVKVHTSNRYFTGHIGLMTSQTSNMSTLWTSEGETALCSVVHTDYTYEGNWNGFYLGARSDNKFLPSIWDSWFNEKLTYDFSSGIATYTINGQTVQNQCTLDDSPYFKLYIHSFGWFTGHETQMDNIKVYFNQIPVVEVPTLNPVRESNDPNAIFTFEAQLSDLLPAGHGVFINFDDQQGDWFIQNTPGGHMQLDDQGNNIFSINYTLEKPGLRSFRAAIFDLKGDTDPSNDVLVSNWSNTQICTLQACLDAVVRSNGIGNPAITGSGSQLFKNVDIATGNYHFTQTDISVPGKGPSFALTRSFNSLKETLGTPTRWSFNYEMKANFLLDTYEQEIEIGPREDGHIQNFYRNIDDGLWYALNPGNFDQLIENTDGSFILYTQGNRLYYFANPTGADSGHLQQITDRLGNALSFSYTGDYLTGATDANSRNYSISRDANNRIQRVTDFASRYVEYSYDTNGMITNVRNLSGGNDQYSYIGTSGESRYQLASITDPRDNLQTSIAYDSNGRVSKLTDGLNNETDFIYGKDGTIGEATGVRQPVVDSLNHNRVYQLDDKRTRVEKFYDAKDYGEGIDANNDITTRQSYKEADSRTHLADKGLVVETMDAENNTTSMTYEEVNGRGNPKTITDAQNRVTQATYTEVSNQKNLTPVATVTQPGVATATQYQTFTATGKATKIIDAEGYSTDRVFDAANGGHGLLTQSTNARSKTTHYAYDIYGNVTTITDADNNTTTNTYYNSTDPSKLPRLKTELSPLGLTTTYTYDNNGNILSRTESNGAGINYTTEYVYDASDNLTQTTDAKNYITHYTYDNLNRKTQESYQVTINGTLETLTKNYSYDALGRLATVTNERSQTNHTHYTERSQVKYKVNPLNKTTITYTYDKNGNVKTVTDAQGRKITTTYDALNRKTRVTDSLNSYDVTDPLNNNQQWTYNTAGQVATFTDSRSKLTSYSYDQVGNLKTLTDAESGTTRSTYDGNGNLLTVTDPNLHTTTYTYDNLDRRTRTTLHNNQYWSYSYDANGNVLVETTPTGEKTIKTYDALNRVKTITEQAADNSVIRQISYEYDANSNISSESSGGNTISYSYDEINRVKSVTDHYGKTINYAYDKAGNRTGLTYPGNKSISYAYDNADRLQSITDWLSNQTTYSKNDSGQTTDIVYGNGTKVHYEYDNAGRLTLLENRQADNTVISSHNMTLDGAGNITAVTATLPLQPVLPSSISSLTYDQNNRIQTADTKSYTHDTSGRIIEEDNGVQTIYNFDINDHISSITQGGATISSYAYDLNNNRISQTQGGVETRYVIDQLASLPNVVAETDDSGAVINYYLYGEGLVSQIDASGNVHYYHYDPTGHTLALTDDSGAVTDRYAYSPYGKTTVDGSTHNPFLYVGKYGVMDDANGLHYMRARYYKEDIKRFMSLDALHGEVLSPQSLNRYAYVLGNPVMGVDPSGQSIKGGLIKIVIGGAFLTVAIASAAAAMAAAPVLGAVAAIGIVVSVSGAVIIGAGGVVEVVSSTIIKDQDTQNKVDTLIGNVIKKSNRYYSIPYLFTGGNEKLADSTYVVGTVLSLGKGLYKTASGGGQVFTTTVSILNDSYTIGDALQTYNNEQVLEQNVSEVSETTKNVFTKEVKQKLQKHFRSKNNDKKTKKEMIHKRIIQLNLKNKIKRLNLSDL
ncbi:MAG: RHS repeat-associated core domain-containing protein [Pseudomonadota bacterium]